MGYFTKNQLFEHRVLVNEQNGDWGIDDTYLNSEGMVAVRQIGSPVVSAILTPEEFAQQYTEIPEED